MIDATKINPVNTTVAVSAVVASAVALWALATTFPMLPPGIGITGLTLSSLGAVGFIGVAIYSCISKKEAKETAEQEPVKVYAGSDRKNAIYVVSPEGETVSLQKNEPYNQYDNTHYVSCLYRWSPTQLLAAYKDSSVALWDLETNQILREFIDSNYQIEAFTALSETHVIGISSVTIHIWNIETAEHESIQDNNLKEMRALFVINEQLFLISNGHSASPIIDSWIPAVEAKGELIVYSRSNSSTSYNVSSEYCDQVALSEDRRMAVVARDKEVLCLQVISNATPLPFGEHSAKITAIAMGTNHRCVTGDESGGIKLWDCQTRHALQAFAWDGMAISRLALRSDGTTAATSNTQVAIWNPSSEVISYISEELETIVETISI